MAIVTRKQTEIYLVGAVTNDFTGSKLPSIHDVLAVYFYELKDMKRTKHEAAKTTIEKLLIPWNKARIPVRDERRAIKKLEDLVMTYKNIKKNKNRQNGTQKQNEEAFKAEFENLFDVAHGNALEMIVIQEDREFLLAQRETGRRGCMIGIDKKLEKKETEKRKRDEQTEKRKETSDQLKRKMTENIVLELTSSSSAGEESDSNDLIPTPSTSGSTKSVAKRGRKVIFTPEVLSSLDRANISDRQAVHTVASLISATGQDIQEYSLNRSSLRRYRMKHREERSQELKTEFQRLGRPITIHWDGKLMPDLTGDEKVDRLPILASADGIDQLLAVPKLTSGTGRAMCDAIIETIDDWNLREDVKAFSFDTTASNTGRMNGACVLLEATLGRNILYLACRNHIHEIMLEEVFSICMGLSLAPEIPLFKRFKAFWQNIIKDDFSSGISDEFVLVELDSVKSEILSFALEQLNRSDHPRDDYRELLELTVIFLGGVPQRGIKCMKPGAMHRARFMARLIYGMKIFIFRNSAFRLTARELNGLKKLCIFGVKFYIKSWFSSRFGISAPKNDLLLARRLLVSEDKISLGALKKLKGHFWYLSEELVGFSFFDDSISVEEKRKMVLGLDTPPISEDQQKRITLSDHDIRVKEIPDFVTRNTNKFFEALSLNSDFLKEDPETWSDNPLYCEQQRFVAKLRVTNDTAERGVALMKEYNGLRTKSEEQTQFILQVVAQHRKLLPSIIKKAITKQM